MTNGDQCSIMVTMRQGPELIQTNIQGFSQETITRWGEHVAKELRLAKRDYLTDVDVVAWTIYWGTEPIGLVWNERTGSATRKVWKVSTQYDIAHEGLVPHRTRKAVVALTGRAIAVDFAGRTLRRWQDPLWGDGYRLVWDYGRHPVRRSNRRIRPVRNGPGNWLFDQPEREVVDHE